MSACSKAVAGTFSALISDGTTRPTGYLWRVVTTQSRSDGFFRGFILLEWEGVTNRPIFRQ